MIIFLDNLKVYIDPFAPFISIIDQICLNRSFISSTLHVILDLPLPSLPPSTVLRVWMHHELLIPIILFFFSLKFLCFFLRVFAFLSSYVFPLSSNFTWITLTVGLSNHVFLAFHICICFLLYNTKAIPEVMVFTI